MSNDSTHPDPTQHFDLSASFSPAGLQEWKQEAERLLRGAPFAKKLFTRTLEGLEIGPLYTEQDTQDLPWSDSLPGQAPYVRGATAGGYRAAPWWVAQELTLPRAAEFNAAAREDLQRGQTALNLVLDAAGRQGLDADEAETGAVGEGGTSIQGLRDLEAALAGISLGRTPLLTGAGSGSYALAALILAHLDKQEIRHDGFTGCVGYDPAAELARSGSLPQGCEQAYAELAELTRWAEANSPGLRTLVAEEDTWHDGGADAALGLGCTLAAAIEHLRHAEAAEIDPATAARRLQFHLSIGSDFFMEIAKLRALRLLWHDVLAASGCPEAAAGIRVHARTSRRTQSTLDIHANLLRSTTQAMSAVFGGVDSLHVARFDEVDSLPDEFGRRIARNQQLILAGECHFDHVADPAGGSYYIEKLTADLAAKAWENLQAIEAEGGLLATLESGSLQGRIAAVASKRADRMAVRKQVQIGTNQYANPAEATHAAREFDRKAFAAERSQAAEAARAEDRGRHLAETRGRIEAVDSGAVPPLTLLAEAALHGATLGELATWSAGGNDSDEVESVPLRRDSAPFELLRHRVVKMATDRPAAGRVFFACLGDFARYMPRLDFTRRFFAVGGFEVLAEEFFTEPAAVVDAASASGATTVVLVGLDETYAELALPTAEALQRLDSSPYLYLAGQPGALEESLRAFGVVDFLNLRSDALTTLGTLINTLTDEEVAR